ncbi:hypothetical protein FE257_003124 [Aspergillus nanangensis]|uniref:HMA domain-containing protein n=1 Tax=Aspergillus nanangensis TaxID=2582783 RepID=A0AAD4GNM7_ASPNN|nr:hypothetical protein FE257_003124 [Aspergillus nanangensis]
MASEGDITPPSRLTTILVNNLHCPSCVTNVEETLSVLHPPPFSVSTSIILQEIKVTHPSTLSTPRIVQALEAAAFEIDSARAGDNDVEVNNKQLETPRRGKPQHDVREQSQLHVSKCDTCSAELANLASASAAVETQVDAKKGLSVAATSVSSADSGPTAVMADHLYSSQVRMTVSISGMSCSSCVSKITAALQPRPWIHSVDVNLLTATAVVVLRDRSHVDEVLDTLKGAGYDAELIECEDIQPKKLSKPAGLADSWRASYIIGGMTCSSCVGKVTDTLNKYKWITNVDVNLVSGSATVEFQDKSHLDEIALVINGLGYKATLSDIESRNPTHEQSSKRSVSIQVDGMHCSHCPQRVLNALAAFSDRLEVTDPPTQAKSLLTVVYTPNTPSFTIRHIMNAIADVDQAFNVSLYHPPSLEERSHAMHRRQQWEIGRRLILAVAVAIPTFIIGIVYMTLVPSENPGRKYLMQPMWAGQASRIEWALFIMATPVYFFGADLFHRRMLAEVKALWRPGSPTPILRRFYRFGSMDMLMSLGTTVAYISSIAILAINATQPRDGMAPHTESFFDSVVFLTMFLLIGRLLEAYSKAKAGDAVGLLSKLRPTEAFLVEPNGDGSAASSGKIVSIPIDQLEFGDVVRVRNGASPPYDGTVVDGRSQFDESSLTGESKPVTKSVGDEVFSGTINQADPVSARITHLSGDSMLDQVIGAVREGQIRRAPIERTADLITGFFVPLITLIAILDWVIWLALGVSGRLPDSWKGDSAGGWEFWSLQFAISVFVVACPCGIGLAAPTALFVGGGLAAQHGILVKGGGEAFQEASQLDCIVFDKTGTLTEGGEPTITDHEVIATDYVDETWGAVLELEHNSSHPIAKAVVNLAARYQPPAMAALSVNEVAGKGMKGSYRLTPNNASSVLDIVAGNEALMTDHGIILSSAHDRTLNDWKSQAKSVVLVGTRLRIDEKPETSAPWTLALMLAVADPVRPEAVTTVKALQDRKVAVWMISGDNATTAQAVGKMVGISPDNIIAGVLPEQKAAKVQYLQKTLPRAPRTAGWFGQGKNKKKKDSGRALVAMVGDGINDSPALTMADVGIAIGSGSDIAISAAEFVLVSSRLTSLLTLVDLSRAVFRRIRFNFAWALVYNCIAVPVAAGVFYPIVSNGNHVRLDPVWASLAMALSSISVICSSLLMKTRLPLVGTRSVGKN